MKKYLKTYVFHYRLSELIACVVLASFAVEAARGAYTVESVVGGLNQPMFLTQAPGENGLALHCGTQRRRQSIGQNPPLQLAEPDFRYVSRRDRRHYV